MNERHELTVKKRVLTTNRASIGGNVDNGTACLLDVGVEMLAR